MSSLFANVLNELSKIAYRKKTWFFLAATLLLSIGGGLLLANAQSGFGIGAVTSGDYPIKLLGLFTVFFLPLFVFMGAADLFSGEQGDRTMKILLTRPLSRFKVFASKQISLCLVIAAYLILALVGSAIASLFLSGGLTPNAVLDWAVAYGAAFVPLAALSFIAVFLAQFFSTASGALTVSLLLYVAAKAGALFFPQASSYSPATYLDWHTLWLGNPMAMGQTLNVFMFLVACSILFFTAGFYFFDKKEL
ncbi:ABC transporter permease [Cohnella terricola]|uniref:ABC transporter permease subunit n=1 Tax=Cohnella terricola TaxID=1289167 RepID=A0A559JMX6_9BACL|nr:ABC transporter permease [Cohnella terricola]TVY01235.1 ABC transporter permease subunit [Cohnella terricola]